MEIVIIGSGFAGLGMAIRLAQAGYRDVVVLEAAGDVGGTWRDNTYPGAACDVPSHLYSFSFAPNRGWTSSYSTQAEILAYLRDCAARFAVYDRIRFDHEVTACDWDEDEGRWTVTTTHGTLSARFLISGTGPLTEPSVPALPGIDGFAGEVWHSARWNHDVDTDGVSVAVVGTGASAVQFVPELQPRVAHLDVYQRTPPWVMPRDDRRFSPWQRRAFRFAPAQLAARARIYWTRELYFLTFKSWARHRTPAEPVARAHLAAQVPDRDLRATLTPDYAIGCKRILLSDDYYPALIQPNVTVVSAGIERVTRTGIVDRTGTERRADVIVLGTGFRATDPPVARIIRGRGGVRLRDAWSGGMAAYKGTTVAGYPNLFLLVGPNTGLGHTSIVYIIESQIPYVIGALAAARAEGASELEVRADVQGQWNDAIQRDLQATVWTTGGCSSWYQDANGRNTTLWPGFSFAYRAAVRRFDPDAYELRARDGSAVPRPVSA